MDPQEQTFQHMCRGCMCKEQLSNSIYDYVNNVKISEMLTNTTPQLFAHGDYQLPKLICSTCVKLLNIAFQFQQLCIESDKHMRSLLAGMDCTEVEEKPYMEQATTEGVECVELEKKPTLGQLEEATTLNTMWQEEDPLLTEELIKMSMKKEISDNEIINFELEKILTKKSDCVVRGFTNDNGSAQESDELEDWNEGDETTQRQENREGILKVQPRIANIHNETKMNEIEKPNINAKPRKAIVPCPHCDKVFDSSYRLNRHSRLHIPTRQFYCEICNYRFATLNQFAKHKNTHLKEPQVECPPPPGGYKCSECPRRFEKRQSLWAHKGKHRKAEPQEVFKCNFCPMEFRQSSKLTKHGRSHPENQKFKCTVCKKAFPLNEQLIEHMVKHTCICEYCNKVFQYNSTLKEHQRIHAGDKPYLCAQCGKCFKVANTLRQHQLRHVDGKPYQCSECPSRFTCQNNLTKHSFTHLGIKPHVCDICGSRFTRSATLTKHKFIHTGQRPHKCEQCNMTFVFIKHLQRHMRTHTGEKPYKCKYCDRDYAESGDLNKHMRTHVGKKTYICDQCPAAFKYQKELREHQSQHYKEQQQATAAEATQVAVIPKTDV